MTRPRRCLLMALLTASVGWLADAADAEPYTSPLPQSKLYLQISPDGRDDLEALFDALEDSVAAGEPQTEPVIIVLHGTEALPFIRRNYLENQSLVDRAAKLRAFDRIDLRMCETWMRMNGFDREDLLPFVDTVPLAPAEVERLEREGYIPFGARPPRTDLL